MTNLDKLTETDGGLRKEQNGVTVAIENGKETCIALIKHDPQTLISIQLDRAETAKLMAYLGGKDLLCDSIKQYEALNDASLERMEELRGTIRDLVEKIEFLSRELVALIEFNRPDTRAKAPQILHDEYLGKVKSLVSLSLEKARKQLEG